MSNGSTSDTGKRKKEKVFFKTAVSRWKKEYLPRLGVFYRNKPTKLTDFMSLLGSEKRKTQIDEEHNNLLEFMKEYWTFSFDFDRRQSSKKATNNIVKHGKDNSEKALEKLKKNNSNDLKHQESTEMKR